VSVSWLSASLPGTVLAALAAGYALTACVALLARRAPQAKVSRPLPPVTVLKPLCGAEPELHGCLRSFCEQDYRSEAGAAAFQIVCGVRDAADPAVAVVQRLQRELPHLDLAIAIDPTQHGASAKVSNLINMMPLARHDYLVVADSDVLVTPDYLARVVEPLLDPAVGIVTCPYRGLPRETLWSLLGALFINDWFMPSVQVAALFGSRAFAFGASIALRRDALEAIGGFAAIANQLADDYRLGELTRRRGLATVLSEVIVDTWVDERSLAELVRHELRWLRTIRIVRPLGYSLSFISFALPLALLGTLLAAGSRTTLVLLAITVAARALIHGAARRRSAPLAQILAAPVSDLLAFALWCWAFTARSVQWRQARYRVARDGSVHPIP
jgi:ceramide glucosyltransferase